jgi:hypothetical protein
MTPVNMWSGGVAYDVEGKGFDPTVGGIVREGANKDADGDMGVRSALLASLLCCNTTLSRVKNPETGEEKWEPKGNSSEAPLVVAARKIGFSENITQEYKRVLEIPLFVLPQDDAHTDRRVRQEWALLRRNAPFPKVPGC